MHLGGAGFGLAVAPDVFRGCLERLLEVVVLSSASDIGIGKDRLVCHFAFSLFINYAHDGEIKNSSRANK